MRERDPVKRFWTYVDTGGDCWIWTAAKVPAGYGFMRWDGRNQPAHRIAYQLLVGPIPTGHVLDHLCRVRVCVNPDHLEPVTHRVNLLRGVGISAQKASRTHCPNGHEFTENNIYWWHNARYCRQCRNDVAANRDRTRPPHRVIEAACVMCGIAFTFVRGPGGRAPNTCSDVCTAARKRKAARDHQRRKRAT